MDPNTAGRLILMLSPINRVFWSSFLGVLCVLTCQLYFNDPLELGFSWPAIHVKDDF